MANDLEPKIKSVLLIFLEGENQGSEIRVNPPREILIGRSEECDIFLSEKKISRKHCKIIVGGEKVVLEDLGSTNGTLLNKKQAKGDSDLQNDDLIQVGTSLIKLSIEQEISAPATKSEVSKAKVEIQTDFEGSSGVMNIVEEPSKSLGMSAMTREQDAASDGRIEYDDQGPVAVISAPIDRKSKNLSGDLSAMGLADLLQNLSQNGKSGLLSLDHRRGEIIVLDGKVIGAKTGGAEGRKAAYRMLAWKEGEFELLPLPEDFRATEIASPIQDSIENLLMEGFRQFDEIQKLKKKLPSLSSKLALKSPLAAPLSRLHPKVLDILQAVINSSDFQEVLDRSPETDLETSKMVYYLIKKEYIQPS